MGLTFGPGLGLGAGLQASYYVPPPPPGQQLYSTPGTYSWTAPAGIKSVSAVCIGPGGSGMWILNYMNYAGGGGGGGLTWKNNISVTPGQTYTVVVAGGASGAGLPYGIDQYASRTSSVFGISATGGWGTVYGEGGVSLGGDGGGNGGYGGAGGKALQGYSWGGGGGAGGWDGAGGAGAGTAGLTIPSSQVQSEGGFPAPGTGGGQGGATVRVNNYYCYGLPASGASPYGSTSNTNKNFGGGGGGYAYGSYTNSYSANYQSQNGCVRIIWGEGRAFPNTNTEDV